ncbi:hypothetical protein GGI05_001965 [Coemansia sp. RSA 2603]|nr:hypothetical protein GGI05_001965 [Coemansia sp. RSA 2603]
MSSANRLCPLLLRRCYTNTNILPRTLLHRASALASVRPCIHRQPQFILPLSRLHSTTPIHTAESERQLMHQQQQRQNPTKPRSAASDISPTPTLNVRLSNLPPGTALSDVRYAIATNAFLPRIKSIHFEHDQNLRPLHSCRVVLYTIADAAEFRVHTNKMVYADHTIRADFVIRSFVPNATRDKHLGNAVGRLVLLYGYPRHMHEHQVRGYYRDYDLVDATIPAVQPAPQTSHTFLTRRGAFILHFATPSEAQRFVRDIHLTEYTPWSTDSSKRQDSDGASPSQEKITLKAVLI